MTSLEAELAVLESLSIHELRVAWRRTHRGAPPASLSRDLLMRAIAYRIQERAHGGLAPSARRRLRELSAEIDSKGASFAAGLVLKAGTRLMREWGGTTHTVIVLEDGFEYLGERYRSLTQIAKRITGTHWSGPRFFRTRKRASQVDAAADSGNA